MDFLEFREQYLHDINNDSLSRNMNPVDVFIENVGDMIINDFNYTNDLILCNYEWKSQNKTFKSMKIDAYNIDLLSNTINLLLADFNNDEIINITNEDKNYYSQMLINFFENVLKGFFKNTEQSAPFTQCANEILNNLSQLNKLNLFIISTNKISERIKDLTLDPFCFQGQIYKIKLNVIDFNRIYLTKAEKFEKEDINIDVEKYGIEGIPCIKADLGTSSYDSYLAIVPGKFLADIYDEYSSRLLEFNVRSFLSFRGCINKGIRGTILNCSDKFFTFNNGISVTAKEINVEFVKNKGLLIKKFIGMQIINGGQTTASLSTTRIKEKASLDNIFVQMKLTVVKENNPDFVHNIAKFANSQNKVTAADLNSNHPYYNRIEDFSRKIYAPNVSNFPYQQLWFFERARGQYEQPMLKMTTKKQREDYQKINPKDKKITKTDLAKFINSSQMYPYDVSWGAEVNLIRFQERLEKKWDKDSSFCNEYYYKEIIGMAILYKSIERIVSSQSWYIQNKAYRPQIVTYSFSKLVYELSKFDYLINYKKIWDKQKISLELEDVLVKISKLAFDNIYDSKEIANISSYCKKTICWDRLRDKKMDLNFLSELKSSLITNEDRKSEIISSKRKEKENSYTDYYLLIIKKGENYWKNLIEKGKIQHVLNDFELSLLSLTITTCRTGKLPSEKQINIIKNVVEKLNANGIQ